MKILVTGGAGYIGSVAVKELINQNNEVIIVDNLSKGKKELIHEKAKFYEIDLIDTDLEKVFQENKIDAVIHFAAYKSVGESMSNAVKYSDNIKGSINLLDMMVKYKVHKIVFSSSAAVYGMPKEEIIDERCEAKPINYYGYTKLQMERLMYWYCKVYGISYVALRYFNVAGDGGLNYVDPNATNVFPIIMEVIKGKKSIFKIFGDDYDTEDGTCVRDYIDVNDLVDAHILALKVSYSGAINLGSGKGFSVKELVSGFVEVTGKPVPFEFADRREGDPACLIASNKKAKRILNWEPKRSIKDMIKSTFDAYN